VNQQPPRHDVATRSEAGGSTDEGSGVEMLGVGKRYSGDWVVRDVSLQLQPGELVVFEGASGSGKSSLLRMIAGISRVSGGDIDGRPKTTSYAPDHLPADERMSARTFLNRDHRRPG
jgi:ABC-type Fe3+/spermidine/putrescine transport system ATPase subunit